MISFGALNSLAKSDVKNLKNKKAKNKQYNIKNQPEKDEFKRITKSQIKDILVTPQIARSDCYLISSLKALAKSGFGKKLLKKSITSNGDHTEYKVEFNKYDKSENASYKIKENEEYKNVTGRNDFNITGAVENSTNKLICEKSDAKPSYLRLFSKFVYDTKFEGNLASVFMKNLTGKDPISVGDKGVLPLSLSNKEATVKLLDEIGNLPIDKHSFVAGSRLLKTSEEIGKTHYYVVKKVDNKKKEVHLVNPRYTDFAKKDWEESFDKTFKQKGLTDEQIKAKKEKLKKDNDICLSYEKFMDNFRSLVGYKADMIKK